jgi:benzodiazapine receptor
MKIKMLLLFLVINFGALAIGGLLMGGETQGSWYASLNKAPWTPPGWVFGAAWFSIMIMFSFYAWNMSTALNSTTKTIFYSVFVLQWVLNVIWNPLFFKWHLTTFSLVVIIALTVVVGWFLIKGFQSKFINGIFVLPYFIWLCIASSLNWYVVVKN